MNFSTVSFSWAEKFLAQFFMSFRMVGCTHSSQLSKLLAFTKETRMGSREKSPIESRSSNSVALFRKASVYAFVLRPFSEMYLTSSLRKLDRFFIFMSRKNRFLKVSRCTPALSLLSTKHPLERVIFLSSSRFQLDILPCLFCTSESKISQIRRMSKLKIIDLLEKVSLGSLKVLRGRYS